MKAALLMVLFAVSFGLCFFARDISFAVLGWPFHFWVASQGAVLVFIVIVVVYAWAMNRLEAQAESEQGGSSDG